MATGEEGSALAARIRELEAANRRLREENAHAASRRRGRWRPLVSALLIVVASLLVPIAIVTAWARVQLIDEQSFVTTFATLVDDPTVQDMIVDETVEAIQAQVDFSELTAEVFDGIAGLGLPPRAEAALRLLETPAANGLEGLTSTAVTRVVESDAFSEVWATLTRAAHRALTTAVTSDADGLVVRTADGVGIQLGVLVERVRQNLIEQGVGVAQLIPSIDRVIIVGDGQILDTTRTAYALVTAVGWWLPLLVLALFVVGVAMARRRSRAIAASGIGLAIGAALLLTSLAIGEAGVRTAAAERGVSAEALDVIYAQIVGAMSQTAVVLLLLGALVAVLGYLLGGSRAAVELRQAVKGINATARRNLSARGFDTGAAGRWLGRQRVLLRVVIVALAVLWLLAMRPLTAGSVIGVFAIAVVVAWVLELLQQREEEVSSRRGVDESSGTRFDEREGSSVGA